MKNLLNKAAKLGCAALLITSSVHAGNGERKGQAGASELLINPWARSSGWGAANSASVTGLEAIYGNVAGLAFTKKTELLFARTSWLGGTDISINAFGFSQRVGESGVLSMGIMSMDFGDIMITTTDLPEGGVGTFSPQYMNMNISYAREFSNSIYGGVTFKVITEEISDVSAKGMALDAGIQYVGGENQQMRFGIALKNVGPRMGFNGDGLSFRGTVSNGNQMTVEQRSQDFELPSLLNIGGSYRFDLNEAHKVTLAGTFTSNSFTLDQYRLGLEYGYKTFLKLRGGFVYEDGILDAATRTNALTGPSAGFTFELPYGDGGTSIGIDYSYRATNPFNGIHSFGARINM
jgi:hypothetical protein